MKNVEDINQRTYNELVDQIAKRAAKTKRVGAAEVDRVVLDLKNAWAHIGKPLSKPRMRGSIGRTPHSFLSRARL